MSHKSILSLLEFQTRVHDVVGAAVESHIKHSELQEKFNKIREEVYSRTTSGQDVYDRYTQGAVCGMIQYATHNLWEFCYRDSSGIIFSTHKDSIHRTTEEFYASGRGCELANMECAHVWKGTDKPFTEWERT